MLWQESLDQATVFCFSFPKQGLRSFERGDVKKPETTIPGTGKAHQVLGGDCQPNLRGAR
jgi:hypothetical protein